MKKYIIKKFNELRPVNRPSPFLPSPYFFSALKGKRSTGTSIIVSAINELYSDKNHRKSIKKIVTEGVQTKQEFKELISGPLVTTISKNLPPWKEVIREAKRLRWVSDELKFLSGALYQFDEEVKSSLLTKYLSDLSFMEESIFRLGKNCNKYMASLINVYHRYPDNFESDYIECTVIDEVKMRELLSFHEITKILNLYADFVGRFDGELSIFDYLYSSLPGDYTQSFWDQLLLESSHENWTQVHNAYEEKYDFALDLSDLRKTRKSKHLTKRFNNLASVLDASDEEVHAYHLAYCMDWHFRQLNESLQALILEFPIKVRIDTAEDRWYELKSSVGAKLPLPTSI